MDETVGTRQKNAKKANTSGQRNVSALLSRGKGTQIDYTAGIHTDRANNRIALLLRHPMQTHIASVVELDDRG